MPAHPHLRQSRVRLLSRTATQAADRSCRFENVAKTRESAPDGRPGEQHPDLLAAVVLQTLVSEGPRGISAREVASACERDPADRAHMREVEAAIDVLLEDGLARREGDVLRPTRPALRASELSF